MADPRKLLSNAFGLSKGRSIATSDGLQAMTNFCQVCNPNNPASTRVGAGLKMLTNVSKAIGKGGKLPISIDKVGSNTKWVLGMVGIDSQTLYEAGQGKNNIIDAGIAAAQGVYEKVSTGTFTINDIPLFHSPLNNLDLYLQTVRAGKADTNATFSSRMDPEYNHPSPWAADLDAALPKYKFLFVVQIKFNAPYLGGSSNGNLTRQISFVAKKSTRPGITYDMTDVNYYNFRTKVVTKSSFEDMTMSFYDDNRNSAATMMAGYMSALSPIVNADTADLYERQGMSASMIGNLTLNSATGQGAATTSVTQPYVANNSGSTGALSDNLKTVIKEITLYQIFDNGRRVNTYTFVNPRVISFALDDVDMSSSELNSLDMKFNYESLHTELSLDMRSVASRLTDLTSVGRYPLYYAGSPTTKAGNIDYGNSSAANAARNGCLTDAASMVSSTIGAVANYMTKLFD